MGTLDGAEDGLRVVLYALRNASAKGDAHVHPLVALFSARWRSVYR